MAALIRKGVYQTPWTIWLPSGEELMIGKNFYPALCGGVNVSPKHAVLCSNEKGSWFIKDTSATHGVFVNTKRIPKGGICEIHNEDSIGLGISEATREDEFEFIFCVNLGRKVHGLVNSRYAHSEQQRFLPVAPKECDYDTCSIRIKREDCNDPTSEDIVIIEEFSNFHVLDNDTLSDTISNSGSCVYYLTDPDEDDPQTGPKKIKTEAKPLSCASDILSSVPTSDDKIQETSQHNEIQCREVHKNVINGSVKTIPENVTDLKLGPRHQNEKYLISEKGDKSACKIDKSKTSETVRHVELVENGDGLLDSNNIQDLNSNAEQLLSSPENQEKSSGDSTPQTCITDNISNHAPEPSPNKKTQKKKNASKPRKRCHLFTRKKKQKNKTKTPSPGKCKQLQQSLAFEDTIEKRYPYIKKCSVTLSRLNVQLVNGSCIIRASNSVASESTRKNIECSNKLEAVEAQAEHSKKIGVKKSGDSTEKPRVFPEHEETNGKNKKQKTSALRKGKTQDSGKRKISYPEGKCTKLMRNYILLRRLENTSFGSKEICKKTHNSQTFPNNSSVVISCPTTVDGNKEVSQEEITEETIQANKTSPQRANKTSPQRANKTVPQQANNKAVSVVEVNKETNQANKNNKAVPQKANNKVVSAAKGKEVPQHLPNGISKKAAPKSPLPVKNNEAPKCTESVPGSNAAVSSGPSSSKKFVIPKKKSVGGEPCQNNVAVTRGPSQKCEQKATNQKTSGVRPNLKSDLSTFTIPKRKKSVDDTIQVKKVCTTYDADERQQEKSAPSKSAYGNHFNRRSGATRRLSEGDSHGGVKRSNDFVSSDLPNKRNIARRDAQRREFESHQSPNSFVSSNSPYTNAAFLENKYLKSPSDGFGRSPMSREENVNVHSFIQMNQVNDPTVMKYSSVTSPPNHSNIPFVPQFPDQMQSKINVLDPRVFRVERSNSLPTYDGISIDGYQTHNGQIQDMDICEPDGSSYLIDCSKPYSSNSAMSKNSYQPPSDQNIAYNVGMTVPASSNCDQLANISDMRCPGTSEVHEKNANSDYTLSVPLRIPSPPVLSELITTSFTLDSVLQQILSWNVNWLQEQRTSSRPPPVTIGAVKKLQHSYFTFDDYVLSFLQLILLETWQLLFTSWSHSRNDEALSFIITNSIEENGSIVLDCQTVTTSIEVPNFPKEGKLLTFEVMSKGGKISKIFGYILKHSVEKKASSEISEELLSFHRVPSSVSLLLVNFTVKIKKKEVNLFRDKLMRAHVIYYLKPHLHVVKSLLELPKSPLVKTILTPKKACCVVQPSDEKNLNVAGSYSAIQQALILGIFKTVMVKDQNPRIITVHGAPGTGKTHLILGILQQLLHVGGKVLITATSDAAVNEIGMRIKSLLGSRAFRNINFIFVGSPDKFSKDLIPFTLREVLKSVVDSYKQKVRRCEEYDTDIQLEIEAFKQSIKDMEERSCPQLEIMRTEQELQSKLRQQSANRDDLFNAKLKLRDFTKNEKFSLRSHYLLSADVIVSTLNNSRQILLEDPSTEKYSFACCMVDEATQSVEPELLQPLIFGMDKIILFGDKDLPPVIYSKASLDYNYELTLSERIHSYFTENNESSPVIKLTEQFRMDPEICMFPSKFFYSNALTSVPQIKTSHFPLVPYVVFNSAKLNKKFKEFNSPTLEEILVRLCKDLTRMLAPHNTIGVILPSNEHQKSVCKVLSRHVDCRNIEINIVDCFQGQEKDVIILPCSTSNGENCGKGYLAHKHKLAIALTRAKKSLIVLGNFETMMFDSSMELLIRDAKERGLCFDLDTLEEIPRYILNKNYR